jgi:eukaryotic-like serine/threonine-protein kinase
VATLPEEGRIIAGRYKLEFLLGKGGIGRVYAATQLVLGRRVAIKMLRRAHSTEEGRARFLREARTCARLVHANIVTVHDFGETDQGELFMVMEYLQGEPLALALSRVHRFPADRAVPIAIEIARALAFAHAEGVIHRDLKSRNVMLLSGSNAVRRERVKVLDFGMAKVDVPGEDALTRPGIAMGSPRYMAPEQIACGGTDVRSDIYAFGAMLFEMVAGKTPFVGSPREVIAQHVLRPAPKLRTIVDVPERLEHLVAHCLKKHPDDRPRSMLEVIDELAAIRSTRRDRPSPSADDSLCTGPTAPPPLSQLLPRLPAPPLPPTPTTATVETIVRPPRPPSSREKPAAGIATTILPRPESAAAGLRSPVGRAMLAIAALILAPLLFAALPRRVASEEIRPPASIEARVEAPVVDPCALAHEEEDPGGSILIVDPEPIAPPAEPPRCRR